MATTVVAQRTFERGGTWRSPGDRFDIDDDVVDELVQYGYVMVADLGVEASSSSERGSATFSGDGATVSFTVSHGLGSTPSHVFVQPTSVDARDAFPAQVTNATLTAFDIVCSAAPVSGVDNVGLFYEVFA